MLHSNQKNTNLSLSERINNIINIFKNKEFSNILVSMKTHDPELETFLNQPISDGPRQEDELLSLSQDANKLLDKYLKEFNKTFTGKIGAGEDGNDKAKKLKSLDEALTKLYASERGIDENQTKLLSSFFNQYPECLSFFEENIHYLQEFHHKFEDYKRISRDFLETEKQYSSRFIAETIKKSQGYIDNRLIDLWKRGYTQDRLQPLLNKEFSIPNIDTWSKQNSMDDVDNLCLKQSYTPKDVQPVVNALSSSHKRNKETKPIAVINNTPCFIETYHKKNNEQKQKMVEDFIKHINLLNEKIENELGYLKTKRDRLKTKIDSVTNHDEIIKEKTEILQKILNQINLLSMTKKYINGSITKADLEATIKQYPDAYKPSLSLFKNAGSLTREAIHLMTSYETNFAKNQSNNLLSKFKK